MSANYTVARPYARAAFEVAHDRKATEQWSEMLWGASLMVQDSAFSDLILHPKFTNEQALSWIEEIIKDVMSDAGRAFLKLLAENQRLFILPEVFELYEEYRKQAEKTVQAFVFSAKPLSDTYKEKIQQALKAKLKAEHVELTCEIDESLMAGAVIKAKDLVIDGSVAGRLSRLGEVLGV